MMEKNKIRVFPKVMKSVDGHGGKDVYLVHNLEEINKVYNPLWLAKRKLNGEMKYGVWLEAEEKCKE